MFERSLFDEFDEMRRFMDRLWTDSGFGGSNGSARYSRTADSRNGWNPPIETAWTEDNFFLRFYIPGVDDEHLKVSVQGHQLLIEGERTLPEFLSGEQKRTLPWYGPFESTIDLPSQLDVEKLDAHLHDGVLDVRIPLTEKAKPRNISIRGGTEKRQIAAA